MLKLVKDNIGEVQNMAIKWCALAEGGACLRCRSRSSPPLHSSLQELVPLVGPKVVQEAAEALAKSAVEGDEQLRDISCLGLKTIIYNIPPSSPAANHVWGEIVPPMLESTGSSVDGLALDSLDVLADVS